MMVFSSRRRCVFISLWCACLTAQLLIVDTASTTTKSTHDKERVDASVSRREGNLDHWDPLTLATYMGIDYETGEPLPPPSGKEAASSKIVDAYAGHDAAILFYAQWCPNCHALAPLWDKIATILKAGTKESNLIMALFDCEGSTKHTSLCNTAGVTHYPTLMFVGRDELHQLNTKKERDILGSKHKKLRRVARFRGNWQYGEQILDWIQFNQTWSRWKAFSYSNPFMRCLRKIFTLPFLRGGLQINHDGTPDGGSLIEDTSLPVGVPLTTISSLSGNTSTQELNQAKNKLEDLTSRAELLEKTLEHASNLLEAVLLPQLNITNDNSTATTPANNTDIFQHLKQEDMYTRAAVSGAFKNDPEAVLLKSCMADLSVDYCNRVLMSIVNDPQFLDSFPTTAKQDEAKLMKEIELKLYDIRNKTEPFCAIVDTCVSNEFSTPECQPDECPFKNPNACRYVDSCRTEDIMKEYKEELKKIQAEVAAAEDKHATKTTSINSEESYSSDGKSNKKGGWGVAA